MARIEIPEGEGHEMSRVWSIAPHMGEGVHALSKAVYEKRVIGSGDRKGQEVKVDIPTSIISHLEFKSGALIDTFFSLVSIILA